MQLNYTTQTWGYKIISAYQINFYHILLPSIPLTLICEHIPEIASVSKESDGSISIYLHKKDSFEEIVKKVLAFFNQKSVDFFDTPKHYYKIPQRTRQSLLSWGLAFEGCLALLLLANQQTASHLHGKWKYLNAKTGGLYLAPYTLLLYTEYPKIVHPVTLSNYIARESIEQTTAVLIRKIFRRMDEAQEGLEGLALLSLVEEKTSLSSKEITGIINGKSFQITAPIHSPFFTSW